MATATWVANTTGKSSAAPLDGTEEFRVNDGGSSKKATAENIKDYILGLANTWTAQNTFAAGTITTSQPLTLTQTWNAGAVAFNALLVNITNTASAAASLLADLQVGGSSIFGFRKDGRIIFTAAASAYLEGTGGSGNLLTGINGGAVACLIGANNPHIVVRNDGQFAFSSTATPTGTQDVILARDAAGAFAQRNGTNAQTFNLYGNYVSSTDYHRAGFKVAKTTLSGVTGASVTATSLIPDGALVIGVTTKVTTELGATGGTTGYQVGDGTDPDRWGEATTITAGTTTDNTNATATTVTMFIAANNVVITAVGGNFDGTGVIDVDVFYLIAQAD